MIEVYNDYSVEEVKELVEAYYGDQLFLTISTELPGNRVARGADACYNRMENFLAELKKRGYKIVKEK